MTITKIKILDLLPETLDTRESAIHLAEHIHAEYLNSQIELDFSGILFMSRSFADQFYKEFYKADKEIELLIKNADVQVIEILNVVSRTQTRRQKKSAHYKILEYSNLQQLSDYTFAW